MVKAPVDYTTAMMLLVGFPVGLSVQVFAERLLLEPYPRSAWGSWLLVGWAAALLLTLVQFILGTIAHSARLGTSFLFFCVPTVLYSIILLALINSMFPKPPTEVPAAFLLSQFEQNHHFNYACVFGLAVLPYIMGFTAFEDKPVSLPQISRIIWMVCGVVGFFVPLTYLVVHKVLWFVAFPLLLALLALYSSPKPTTSSTPVGAESMELKRVGADRVEQRRAAPNTSDAPDG